MKKYESQIIGSVFPGGEMHQKSLKADHHQVILCALFGMVKWPFQRLSDLQLGEQKVTLNHLADRKYLEFPFDTSATSGLANC